MGADMGVFLTLVRRELGIAFNALTGYVVVAITLLLAGYGLTELLGTLNAERTDAPITEMFFGEGLVFWLILIVITPVITMRSFASEKALGTYESLMTTPVGDWQVVLAKFAGAFVFYLASWIPMIGVLIGLRQLTGQSEFLDPRAMVGSLIGIACVGSTYLSAGIFASSLTRSQIIAAMTSLLIGVGVWASSFRPAVTGTEGDRIGRILDHLSVTRHMQDFARGVIDGRALVFHLSFTVLFLFLTHRVVEMRRWK
jgi:ABC-2 type transport system permease protein